MTDYNYAARMKRRKRRRRKLIIKRLLCLSFLVLLIASICYGAVRIIGSKNREESKSIQAESQLQKASNITLPDWVDVQIIKVHGTARSGKKLTAVKNIVIHYVGNPGTTAQNNRDFFDKSDTEVSSHFVVGLDGEIIQCVPLNEKSAASNWRNSDTISVEVCHPDESGVFNQASYNSLIRLTAWLCHEFGLDEEDVIRHYDITGKMCPLYYAEHEDKWEDLKNDVKKELGEYN